MPKATVNKNNDTVLWQHEIRPPSKVWYVEAKTKPSFEERRAHVQFWRGILPSNLRHVSTTLFMWNSVGHFRNVLSPQRDKHAKVMGRHKMSRTGEEKASARSAKHGEKMIEVKVRFWTDGIAPEDGKVVPKHAWAGGVVRVERNDAHGLVPSRPKPFNSLLDLGAVIEKVLIEHGVSLLPSRKMQRYMKAPRKS
jgi:hypothetical protein